MEELTMLVQLAGGDLETTRRLRDAGFRRAKDIARAGVHELCEQSGLSMAATRWLVRSAKEILAPANVRQENEQRRARIGLRCVPSAAAIPTASRSRTSKPAAARQPGADQGVSKAESSALLDEAAHEQTTPQSFWRFG